MSTLIVHLPTEPPQATSQVEYVLSPDGRTLGAHSSVALALLPAAATSEVVAVVPVQMLSWHTVQIPRGLLARGFSGDRAAPRLRAVLDGLLEEQVLDEPANLHMALAPDARDGAAVQVAVCDRAWLRAWMQALEQYHHPATRIVPEFAPPGAGAAESPQVLNVIGNDTMPLMVLVSPNNASGNGLTVLPLHAGALAFAGLSEGQAVQAEPAVAALAERVLGHAVALQSRAERCLAASASGWDLAQFDLISSGNLRRWRRLSGGLARFLRAPQWRAARWAAAALIIVNLAGLNAWAWAQRTSLDAKRQAVREVLTGSFPGVKVVVDAPVQMAREVLRLRLAAGAVSASDFEMLLGTLGELELAGKTPAALDYAGGVLRVKGLGAGDSSLSALAGKARARGVSLRLEGDMLVLAGMDGAP